MYAEAGNSAYHSEMATLLRVLIPNTWRRCLSILSLMVLGAVGSVFVAAYVNPALYYHRFRIILAITPFIVAFAAIGLYGSHELATLGKQAFTAQQVGQYVLKQQIGKGGMGEVFLAQHRLLRRPCAVKLIRSREAGSASSLLRFEREVQAMARLTHPNTVEIYDYGRTRDGTFYYAMEYYLVSGRPPFLRSTAAQMYKAHLSEEPAAISTYVPSIPADLAAVLHRCLAKDPAQRFADIRELESALLSCGCAHAWDSEQAARWWTAIRESPSRPVIASEPDHNSVSVMHTIDAASRPSPA